jgi:hypothetical protein
MLKSCGFTFPNRKSGLRFWSTDVRNLCRPGVYALHRSRNKATFGSSRPAANHNRATNSLVRGIVPDLDCLAGVLARQKPAWKPGTRQAYHALTLGFYEGELLRRVDP